jgi:hypothetical protein
LKLAAQKREVAFDPAFATDQDMVGIRQAANGQQFAQQGPEATLHAVAHDGVTDALGDGNAEAKSLTGSIRPAVRPRKQHEAGACYAQPLVGGQEIGAPGQYPDRRRIGLDQADSFLRPRARRARRMFRPPTVAVRARKPWRRARTRLLGWKVRFIERILERRKESPQQATVKSGVGR